MTDDPDVLLEADIPVEMSDGTTLMADIYRDTDQEEGPVLLQRTPYNKDGLGGSMFKVRDAVRHGYIVVGQDVRGRAKSEGEWTPFINEQADGYDTVEWVASQPWCNGKVGVWGASYPGYTSLAATVANPPSLDAAVSAITGPTIHNEWVWTGGAFQLAFNLYWTLGLTSDTFGRLDLSTDQKAKIRNAINKVKKQTPELAARFLPLKDMPPFQGGVADYWQEWLDLQSDPTYRKRVDLTANAGNIEVPLFHVTGWYEYFQRGHFKLYDTLMEQAGEYAKENHRFVIGPWHHETIHRAKGLIGDKYFGHNATNGSKFYSGRVFQWFDYWLQDEQTGVDELPRVEYYDSGEKAWDESDDWPPDTTRVRRYFHSGGNANSRFGDGKLTQYAPREPEPADSYEYDPVDPVPTTGGRIFYSTMGSMKPGIQDQSRVEERPDILVYTSPRQTTPLTIAGPVHVVVYASSTARDTDFTAKLVDVEPTGYCANIAEGIVRARYRNGWDESFIEPGTVYEYSIDLSSVAHTFKPDHRVRVEISSSNFPQFDRNMNSRKPIHEVTEADMNVATQQILHSAEYPSHLVLPRVE